MTSMWSHANAGLEYFYHEMEGYIDEETYLKLSELLEQVLNDAVFAFNERLVNLQRMIKDRFTGNVALGDVWDIEL